MGGKTKQSQRTKNNARPSSSGRSAELLSSVKLDSGIVNIAGTQLPALFPSLVAPSVDPLISPELQLCFKKLNKKDPITKTKALQELSELVVNSSVDDVVSALSSWSHFYKILTTDPDRKVRECTQACHSSIVGACGRRLAPHLKHVMPAWLRAQHDEHAPAQAHARHSLAKTFPDTKLPEVMSFCKEAIMSSLLDVLLGNGETVNIKTAGGAIDAESANARAQAAGRAEASSLRALQQAAQQLPAPQHGWLREQLAPLLQHARFWSRAHHHEHRIRAAWFGAVGSIISRYQGEFAAEYGVKTMRVLVGVRESNPLVAAEMWECMLLFMHNVPDWHQYLEKKELLCIRILDLLESGGWGDARHLSNMLLLILASLPEEILTKEFYISFFDAMFRGLKNKTILSSKSERQHWITSLEECLRYLSTQSHRYSIEVVTSVHRTWLEKVITDNEGQIRNHLVKFSAGSMVNLLKYWLKQTKEGNTDKFEQLIRNFWQNVGSTLCTQIDNTPLKHEDIDKLIEAHILLLQSLKTSFTQELKKRHSIKFEVDSKTTEDTPPVEPQRTDPNMSERFNHNLNELVQKICSHYMEFAKIKEISKPVISPLITLLVEFDSEGLFLGIARRLGCESVYALYERALRGWLAGDALRCKALVDFVFMLMTHLTEQEQDALLDTFKQFPPSVVEWCLSLSLSHPHCLSPSVRRWLRGPVVEATVTSICSRVIETGDGKAKNLLMMCLNGDANGESVVRASCVAACVAQLSASLYGVHSAALETRCSVAAQASAALPPSAALLTAFLSLTATLQRGDPRLSLETWCEVRDAWQDGVTSLDGAARAAFLQDAAALLHRHLHADSNVAVKSSEPESSTTSKDSESQLNLSKMEHIVSLCPYLVWSGAGLDTPDVERFSRTVLRLEPRDPARVHAHALRHAILTGNLNCPFEDDAVVKAITSDTLTELSKDDLITYLHKVLFRSMYLRTMLLHRPDEEADRNWCRELLAEDYFQAELVNCIHEYTVLCFLYEGYAFWPHYKIIEQGKNRLKTLLEDIINETNAETRRTLSTRLTDLATSKGYFWAYARKYFEDQSKLQKDNSPNDKDNSPNDKDNSPNNTDNSPNNTDNRKNYEDNSESGKDNKVESESIENAVSETSEGSPLVQNLKDMIFGPTLLHTLHYLQAKTRNSTDEAEILRTKYYIVLQNMYIAHLHEPEVIEGLLRDVTDNPNTFTPDVIINTYYAHNHTMLYEKELSEAPWQQIVSNASICSLLRHAVAAGGWQAAAQHWDFTNISLCSLLSSVLLSKERWGSHKVSALCRATLLLFSTVAPFVRRVPLQCERRAPAAHVAALPAEWRDIYAPDLHHNLFQLILHVLESCSDTVVSSNHVSVLDALAQCAPHVRWSGACGARAGGACDACSLPRLTRACCAALAAPAHTAFKYLAHTVMQVLLKPLVLEDAERLAAWSARAAEREAAAGRAGEVEPLQLTLAYYADGGRRLQALVETALSHLGVCEEVCSLLACTDAHALALGWLLLADLLHRQCALAHSDLAHHYILVYRELKCTEPLLRAALRLVPAGVLRQAALSPQPAPHAAPDYGHMFTALPPLDIYSWCGGEVVAWAACACVSACVRGAGAAAARSWRGAAHHTHAHILDNITRRYITPHVVKEEFALLQKKSSEIEDTEVTINRSSYEVRCVLAVDEKGIELLVTLAPQHPLVLPRLCAPHAAAGNINWILMYLGYQNGTILNALKMWTVSVNNKMERAPQCYICYCRLHHATGRLPSVHCHTCRNKFHNVCLRKWFQSSGKMTCPLCRGNF